MAEICPTHSKVVEFNKKMISSFKITEQDWKNLVLKLIPDIPEGMVLQFCMITKHEVGIGIMVNNDQKEKAKMEAKFILKSSDEEAVDTIRCDQVSTKEVPQIGKFIAVSKLVEIDPEKYDQERSFFVDVDVTIELDESLKTQEMKRVELYSLGKELKTINQEDNSDFLIRVDGGEFKCHKNILIARSEYFKVMFTDNYIEDREMDVREAIPAKTIENVLNYNYTGEIPSEVDLNNILLQAADMSLLDVLLANLNVNTCLATFVLVDKHLQVASPERNHVLKFMMCKAAEVLELEEWAELVKKYPDLSIEFTSSLAKMLKFKGKHWCQHCDVTCKAS